MYQYILSSIMSQKNIPIIARKRLQIDYLEMKKNPVSYITAEPLPSNILDWHYVLRGADDTPYKGGIYHGRLVFPKDFPFKPPSIYMLTPNGRFQCNARLCLSISDFHPESWRPSWTVSAVLVGLASFMVENTRTFGSIQTTVAEKKILAANSGSFNLTNPKFCELFPDIVAEIKQKMSNKDESSK